MIHQVGSIFWFEYHCLESAESADAIAWYHSHQKVEVLGVAECDGVNIEKLEDRIEAKCPLVYRVKFQDGLEYDVFEDELLTSPEEFSRPAPPSH